MSKGTTEKQREKSATSCDGYLKPTECEVLTKTIGQNSCIKYNEEKEATDTKQS